MKFFQGNSIARKMTTMVLLASGLALATFMAAFLVFDGMSSRARLQERLAALGDVVGQNTADAIHSNRADAATEVLKALRTETPVMAACLYDPSGNLFAQYTRQAGGGDCARKRTDATAGELSSEGLSSGNQGYAAARPLLRQGELVGTLVLSSDLTDLQKRRNDLLRMGSVLLLLALGVGGAAGVLLQRRTLKPLANLVQAMHEISADRKFEARVAVCGASEIAELGRGFNAVLAELEERDVEKKEFEAELERQALNDELTGLPNRRLFADRFSHCLAAAVRDKRTVALLYIDLDGFKFVNDSLGHMIGDILLVHVATRLQSRIRKADTLARLGGDEFGVILETLHDRKDAEQVAATLLESLAKPFMILDNEITIAASIGISLFPEHAQDPTSLMQQADSAMYEAKRLGKNRATYFTPEIGLMARERMSLESQLRGAIERGEIEVHYQPEYDVPTGRLVRFEALARWHHPTIGPISPVKFIPIAEEIGMIYVLTSFVMETACREAAKWESVAGRPIEVAVNVSGMEFDREGFVDEVMEILAHTGLKPELLQLELTERIILSGSNRCMEAMKRLRALGISLAIDDFGTGYSSLSYLANMPFNAIKIDRSFVVGMDNGPANKATFLSIVTLAHSIGMRVIVEGIEQTEQWEMMKELGANEVQGYLMGRPTADPVAKIGLILNDEGRAENADSRVPAKPGEWLVHVPEIADWRN